MTKKSTFNAESNKIYNLGVLEEAKVDPAKVGDYFYSDGTYSTELDSSKEVVAVVFYAGNPKERFNDAELPDQYCNGLAISVSSRTCAWNSSKLLSIPDSVKSSGSSSTQISTYNVGGYTAMQAFGSNNYTVFANGEAPAGTSGWYLGTPMEWNYILANKDVLNGFMSNVNGAVINPQNKLTSYWLPIFYGTKVVIVYLNGDEPYYYYEEYYYIPQNANYCYNARPIFAF